MLKSAVWFLTMACNYECPYCWEAQYQKKGNFKPHPIPPAEKWLEALNRLKPKVLDITGGEPFLMPRFVWLLENLSPEIRIAITTNLSLNVEEFLKSPAIKKVFSITCSYHPSMSGKGVTLDDFTQKVLGLKEAGVAAVTVNFVAFPGQIGMIPELVLHFERLGIRFHVDPYASMEPVELSEIQKNILEKVIEADRKPDAVVGNSVMCSGGHSHLSIQPDGTAYRCILDKQLTFEKHPNIAPLGNIFDPDFKLNEKMTFCDQRYRCPGCDKDKVTIERI